VKIRIASIAIALLLLGAQPAFADLRAVACEPEWGALLKEIGGDEVRVFIATTAMQDPHHVEPRPSLIARFRNAQFIMCTGAELEIGWLPILLQQASANVQPGQPGYFEAASVVRMLEVPTRLDRAEGDVHPQGNPHIQTDPRNIALVAKALAGRLGEIDPRHAARYQRNYEDFAKRWQAAMGRWQAEAAPLKGVAVVAHHKSWIYLEDWLGMREVGVLEPKPGVPPTTSHLIALLGELKRTPAKMILRSPYEDPRADQWLSDQAHIPAVLLPFSVGGTADAKDLISYFDATVRLLVQNAK
jgi:zinc/manganese transport system substrate-binding protein